MKVKQFPKIINEELAEETGWHIGDGSMNYYKNGGKRKGLYQLRGHIEDDKPHYIQRIKPLFKKLYGIDISLREMPSTRVFGFQIWNNNLVKFKQHLGIKIGPKLKIRIPQIFLTDKKLKVAIIRGIFDTDGCVYLEKKNHKLYPRLQIATISSKLANQLTGELNSLEFRATQYKDFPKLKYTKKRIAHIITIRGVAMLHKFFKEISPKNSKHIFKYNKFVESTKALKMNLY